MSGTLYVLGIDPGLDGGLAFLSLDNDHIETRRMAVRTVTKSRRDYDLPALRELLRHCKVRLAVLEFVRSRPEQSVTSMFSMGRGVGLLEGMLAALCIPYQTVVPQVWKKKVLTAAANHDKQAAIAHVQRRYPQCDLLGSARARSPHDGIADAVCIAEYGRRILLSQ